VTVKAILFDMDGVLIEAKDWHFEALNRALERFDMSISRSDHLNRFDGLPTRKKLELLTAERGLPAHLHTVIDELKQSYTIEIVHARCMPNTVHEFALSSLKSAGYKLAVCSNSVRQTVMAMMAGAKLTQYLDLIISNQDVQCAKPDPEMYLKAMTEFDVIPTECLVVEDHETGIKAARASGAHLLVVNHVLDTNFQNISAAIGRANGCQKLSES
jgi:beta-phosphoglucomutase